MVHPPACRLPLCPQSFARLRTHLIPAVAHREDEIVDNVTGDLQPLLQRDQPVANVGILDHKVWREPLPGVVYLDAGREAGAAVSAGDMVAYARRMPSPHRAGVTCHVVKVIAERGVPQRRG